MKSHLLENHKTLYKIKHMLINNDNTYYSRTIINKRKMNQDTISIVMTSCNRSAQTYFTLKTISNSEYKNIQIIIVDDSTKDFLSLDHLKTFDMHIELINIKNKYWINPCINYNIGFNFIKGGKVIIQNAEVCHLGDVINYVMNNVIDGSYYAFNVLTIANSENNTKLHDVVPFNYNKFEDITKLCGSKYYGIWYQHHIHRNIYYHFLTACTKNTFDIFKGFDIDYAFGIEYDDDQLVTDIKARSIALINAPENIIGIHQWHEQSSVGSLSKNVNNKTLFECKKKYNHNNKTILRFSQLKEDDIVNAINSHL